MFDLLNNMKIFFKIFLIIFIIIIFMVVLAIMMNMGLNSQKTLIEQLTDVRFELYDKSSSLLEDILIIDSEFEILLLISDEGIDPEAGNAFMEKSQRILSEHIEIMETMLAEIKMTEEEKTLFKAVKDNLVVYRRTGGNMLSIGQVGGNMGKEMIIGQARNASAEIKKYVSELHQYESNAINEIKSTSADQINKQTIFFYIICLISIVLPLIISFFIARSIIKPIHYLEKYSQQIAGGDLRAECNLNSQDEMGNLSESFNKVVLYIKDFISSIKNIQSQNMDIKNKLIAGTSETFASITQISSNLNSSVTMLNNLNTNVSSSVSASDEITRIFEDFRRQVEDQSASVAQSSASIEQIITSIKNVATLSDHRSQKSQELLELTETGRQKMNESNEKVKEMSAITDNMLEAIDIIKDIAEQTNLLSINSAIEAAHAGEAGKSFAVVSDEIRKLAESSTESSKMISNNLKKNVDMIKAILDVSDESSRYFQTIGEEVKQVVSTLEEISNAMQSLATSGNQISTAISTLKQITGDVQLNSTNIEDKVKEIKTSITKVDDVTSEVVNAITEINFGANQINTAMSQLSQDANMIEKGIMETSRYIDKFLI